MLEIEDIYELTPMQQGMLYHSLRTPASSPVHFIQIGYNWQGRLDREAFRQAWRRVVDCHAVLRTSILWEDLEKPVQVVYRHVDLPLEELDLQGLELAEQEAALNFFLEADRRHGFKLTEAPLMRLAVIRLQEEVCRIIWSFHHILFEGWSASLIHNEFLNLYQAICSGEKIRLPQRRPYRDYILWLQQLDLSKAESYWRATLQGLTTPTPLRFDQHSGSVIDETVECKEKSVKLSAEITATIQSFTQRHRLTLNVLVQGAWAVILSRYSGEEDVVFGTVVSGRQTAPVGAESMIGLFINTLPTRVMVASDDLLVGWLRKLQERQLEMLQYEYSPLVRIQEWSQVRRGAPLFESFFVFENWLGASLPHTGAGDIKISHLSHFDSGTGYPFAIGVLPSQELTIKIAYDRNRFRATTVVRILGQLRTVLQGMVCHPESRVGDLSLVTEAERFQLLTEWNDTSRDFTLDRCLPQLFDRQAGQSRDAIAAVFADEHLSYGMLSRRSNQVARYLIRRGVRPDVPVGLFLDRSLEMVIGIMGVLKSGGAYVPLDPTYPAERLAWMVEDAGAPLLLTHLKARGWQEAYWIQEICLDTEWEEVLRESDEEFPSGAAPENLAYIIYTSGSTGRPKGVALTHKGLCNMALAQLDAFETMGRVVLQFASLSFDAASFEWTMALLAGGRLVLAERERLMPGPDFIRLLERENIEIVTLPPTVLASAPYGTVPALQTMVVAGEAVRPELVRQWGTGRRMLNAYGPTETTVWATISGALRDNAIPEIGRPIANARLYVLDREGQVLPVGIAGELYIGGEGLGRGYLNQPRLTAEKYVPDPFGRQPGARSYRSGDLVCWRADGNLEFLGRIDGQVKIRGHRIEPSEIEVVLSRQPGVRQVAVVVREDEPGQKQLIAYVCRHSKADETAGVSRGSDFDLADETSERARAKDFSVELRQALQKSLPSYMTPTAFVLLEEMPLTPNGKLDREGLPNPLQKREEDDGTYIEPRTPTEEILVGIWELMLKRERIGIHNDFFDLGGHSLLATQIVSRVQKAFRVELPLQLLFEAPTVAGLSASLDAARRDGKGLTAPPIEPTPRDGQIPLSFAQQRLWFIDRLEPGNAVYNIPGAVRLEGRLNLQALESAINEIARRHEVLRMRIGVKDGASAQVIDPWGGRRLQVGDLTNLPSEAREEEVWRAIEEEAETGFDLGRGPMLRVKALKLEEESYVALFTMHHIVSDGWSMGVLGREVCELYEAMSEGKASPLPELEIQYADYAVWQRRYLTGEALEGEVRYWKERLKDVAVMELPTDHARPAAPSHRGGQETVEIGKELSEELKRLSQQEGATLFMVLMAAFKALLMRYSGEEDVSVGTVVANRTRKEVEVLIGFFVNTLVMRTDLGGNPSFRELIKREREVALGAYAHQEAPFEKLVEEINPDRDLSRSPLFQVMMALQNTGREALKIRGLKITGIREETKTAKFDLTLSLAEGAEGVEGFLEYSRDLYEGETIRRMARHYEKVVREVVTDAGRRIGDVELMSEEEKEQVIVEFNRTRREYEKERLIHELIEEQVECRGQEIAVVYEEERVSYEELNRRANQLARYLVKLGVSVEDRVGICVERKLEMIVGLLGILKAGGAYVPLDPSYPRERLKYMLKDAEVKALVTQGRMKEVLSEPVEAVVCIDADWPLITRESGQNLDWKAQAENLAYVIYTSGSTGRPKGVAITHRSAVTLLQWAGEVFDRDELKGVLASTSICFDLSVFELMVPLSCGGKVVLAENALGLPELKAVAEVRLINTVPSAMRELVGRLGIPESVETVNLAGEALRNELAQQIYDRGKVRRVLNLYGPTEDTTYSTWTVVNRGGGEEPTLGRPIANTEVYILDQEMRVAPVGVYGEIYISGGGLARCYLNRPEITAEMFLPNPFGGCAGERLYRTGDIGRYVRGGNIEYKGRKDHQVKVRGFRIELGEVEARLARHPAIREAVALVREDTPGDKRLVAYYTLTAIEGSESGADAETLRAHLLASLPEYMAPSAYVALDALPLTPNGKLDRRALPAPGGAAYPAREYEAPVGATETALARIWAEALNLDRVGRHDHFFALGGHSLLAVAVIERMRGEGLQADVRSLFTTPTVAGLAAAVGGDSGAIEVPPNRIPLGCAGITPEMLPLVNLTQSEIDGVVAGVAGGAANVQDIYPLAPLQEGILFHHLMTIQGDAYLLPCLLAFDTRGRLDGLLEALRAVIARHDILRTAVVWEGLPEPAQVVWREAPLTVEEVELDPSEGEAAEQLRALFDPRRIRIDVRQAPLMRCVIARDVSRGRWLLLWLLHHLAVDHTSLEIMEREMQAHLQGETERLPAPLPFRNFVAQARLGIEQTEHEAFFRAMLGDVEESTAPFGLLDAQGDGSGIKEARTELGAILSRRLRARARAVGVSAATLYHLAWALVLGRVSGREDVVFGTVLSGGMQGGQGAGRMLGPVINTLPVRIRVGEESVRYGVRQTHDLLTQLLRHEHAPLALAQRCSAVAAPAPLFSALLNYRHDSAAEATASGKEALRAWEGIEALGGEERTNYPFNLHVDDWGEGFTLSAQAQPAIAPERVCAYMRTALEQLEEALDQAPTTLMRDIDIVPAWERHQALVEWNATEAERPKEKRIHELFEGQVEKGPDAVALMYEVESVTYDELNARADQLGSRLRKLGVGPETSVGVCMDRGVEMVVGLLGILKAGGAYVPIDPAYPAERKAYMMEDVEVKVALTQRRLASGLPPGPGQVVCLDEEMAEGSKSGEPVRSEVSERNLAYVIYTSGSTGKPKGVAIEHRSALEMLEWASRVFGPEERASVLASTSICFDLSVFELFLPLCYGGKAVVVENALSLAEEEELTLINTVPSAMAELIKRDELWASVRTVNLAGEALSNSLAQAVYERGGVGRVYNLYGPSEDTTYSSFSLVSRGAAEEPTIGRPVANTRMYVLDGRAQAVAAGVKGELYIGGAGLARCYQGRPEMTAERFVPDGVSGLAGERLYRTGDVAKYKVNGEVEYCGREDHQVKVRGYRIELGEVEEALSCHPAVWQTVVAVQEDDRSGKRLIAYVAPNPEMNISVGDLKDYLKKKLPTYMIPSIFSLLPALPLTPNGKIDRHALQVTELISPSNTYNPPRNMTEDLLIGIWKQVLGKDQIGIEDNFFDLGGHSLLAMQIFSRVREALRVEAPMRLLFESPTVAGLAAYIESALRDKVRPSTPPLAPAAGDKGVPLSFAQRRLWVLDQMIPNLTIYNIPAAVRLSGKLNLAILEQGLSEIVRRHEVLRTRFVVIERQTIQLVEAPTKVNLPMIDLSTLSETKRGEILRQLIDLEPPRLFNLSKGPLFRATVMRLSTHEHIVLLTMHHIVADGWSVGVLIRELEGAYKAFCHGAPSQFPELLIQYADYSVWQLTWAHEAALESHLAYWRRQLADVPQRLRLRADRTWRSRNAIRSACQHFYLSRSLCDAVSSLSRDEGVTVFMTLLTAYLTLLYRHTGQGKIPIGVPVANRNHPEIEKLIGFFVNILVVCADVHGDKTFRGMLKRVREVVLEAYTYQDTPFDLLVKAVLPERSLSYAPLVQATFTYQNAPMEALRLPNLELTPIDLEGGMVEYDLSLIVKEEAAGLRGLLAYNNDILDAATIDQMIDHFRIILEQVVYDPDVRLLDIPLLGKLRDDTIFSSVQINDGADEFHFKSKDSKCLIGSIAE